MVCDDCIKLMVIAKESGVKEDISIDLNYNILDVYNEVRNGEPYKLKALKIMY